jgi:hypothetical protein
MKKNLTITICIVVFVLTACQSAAPVPTSMPQATNTDTVIPTSTFTATPKPTRTPIPPTSTVEPPAALSKYLNGVTVFDLTTFDTDPNMDYNTELVSLQDDKLQFKGQGWETWAGSRLKYKEGQGIIFDFTIDSSQSPSGFEFETYFDLGTWWTASYRRFGVYITAAPQADMWVGQRGTGKYLTGDLKLTPDVWYQVMVVIDKNADFLSVIWDPNNPDVIRKYRIPKGGDWSGQNWNFVINGSKGTMLVDNLMSISFESIK